MFVTKKKKTDFFLCPAPSVFLCYFISVCLGFPLCVVFFVFFCSSFPGNSPWLSFCAPSPWFLILWKITGEGPKNGQNSIWGKNRTSLNMPRSCSAKPTVQFNPRALVFIRARCAQRRGACSKQGRTFSAKPYVQCRAVRLMQGRTFNMQGARHRPTKSLRIPCFRLAFAAQDSSVVLQECMPWS